MESSSKTVIEKMYILRAGCKRNVLIVQLSTSKIREISHASLPAKAAMMFLEIATRRELRGDKMLYSVP
jgi:hypothetical protein